MQARASSPASPTTLGSSPPASTTEPAATSSLSAIPSWIFRIAGSFTSSAAMSSDNSALASPFTSIFTAGGSHVADAARVGAAAGVARGVDLRRLEFARALRRLHLDAAPSGAGSFRTWRRLRACTRPGTCPRRYHRSSPRTPCHCIGPRRSRRTTRCTPRLPTRCSYPSTPRCSFRRPPRLHSWPPPSRARRWHRMRRGRRTSPRRRRSTVAPQSRATPQRTRSLPMMPSIFVCTFSTDGLGTLAALRAPL